MNGPEGQGHQARRAEIKGMVVDAELKDAAKIEKLKGLRQELQAVDIKLDPLLKQAREGGEIDEDEILPLLNRRGELAREIRGENPVQ